MLQPNPSVTVLIPARYGSSRFPGKPLANLAGRPMIQHVYESALQTPGVSHVRIVTDDSRIVETAKRFHGEVSVVDSPCRTGTDRIAKVVDQLDCQVVVNLQADEIPLHPDLLGNFIQSFLDSDATMGTLKRALTSREEWENSSIVKVVTDSEENAVYFSRLPIPFIRDGHDGNSSSFCYYGHLGIYMFRRDTILQFAELPTGVLEDAEKLEQLRALENGIPIRVWETKFSSCRIDNPEDLETASEQLRAWPNNHPHSCSSTATM